MAQFRVLGTYPAERIVPMLPPEYRDLACSLMDPHLEYTAILFGHDRGDVVLSGAVRRALGKLPSEAEILAVGGNFTREATLLLEERGAIIARLGEFYWTDESYTSLPR